jgi:hypothetical protein
VKKCAASSSWRQARDGKGIVTKVKIRIWHIVFFIVALVAFGIARAPAAAFAPQAPGQFTYARAHGTVWQARFEQVQLGSYAVDELNWRLSFWGLVQGKAVADVLFSGGDIDGDLQLLANWGGDRRIVAPRLSIAGASVGQGLNLDGTTSAQGIDIFFDAGRCAAAAGNVQSDILARNEAALRWRGPPMSGVATCEGEDAIIVMNGSGVSESVRALVRLRGDGGAEWRAEVSGARPEVTAVLAAAGFSAGPQSGAQAAGGEMRWTPF